MYCDEVLNIILGSSKDFIDLKKYTDKKDTITVEFANSGKVFKEWDLEDGLIVINRGAIDYSKYENPHCIPMRVRYQPCDMPISIGEINTIEGLERNIIDIESFVEITKLRRIAHKKFGIRLEEFIVFDTFLLDLFGQTMKVTYEGQSEGNYEFKDLLTFDDFKKKISSFSYSNAKIPSHKDRCPHCKHGWSLSNIRDVIAKNDDIYHIDCHKFMIYEKAKKEFDYIASRVFEKYRLIAVKNEYGSEAYRGSWFIINTSEGDIRIGWRKRVIQIEWLDNYRVFSFNGENHCGTKVFSKKERFIHVDNELEAIEVLQKAKRSIV